VLLGIDVLLRVYKVLGVYMLLLLLLLVD